MGKARQTDESRFRKRIGEAGAEELLKQTIVAGLKLKAIKPYQLNPEPSSPIENNWKYTFQALGK